ncbi:hypothetical protein, partial [uncultured Bacteroides sp.]|uniref:hypothetical protein n=1 Tax=uncultured Bacteroides sp. TaxID=162156 RepID=UPI0032203E71
MYRTTYRFPAMLWSRVSFRLSVRQAVSRVILRGCALVNSLLHPIWAQHDIACTLNLCHLVG